MSLTAPGGQSVELGVGPRAREWWVNQAGNVFGDLTGWQPEGDWALTVRNNSGREVVVDRYRILTTGRFNNELPAQ